MEKPQKFSALYNRDFRLFWFGQVVSLSGTWMQSLAQSWLVYSLTKSPLYLGIVASAASLPILAFTLIGGIVADKYQKRNVIILTQILSIVPALALGILTDSGTITVWQVALAAAFLGTVNAFDVPARQAFLAEVVGRGDITNAIALNSAAFNGARIVGPVAAGFLIATMGMPVCFYVNAISFVPVIFTLFKVQTRGVERAYDKDLIEGIVEGWRFVEQTKPILFIMLLISVFSLFGLSYITLLPVLAAEVFHRGAQGLSFLIASAGAGSLLAATAIAFKGDIKRKERFIPIAAVVFSLSLLGLALSENFYLALLLVFVAGWGIVSFLSTSNSFIQHAVSDLLRGRVMSLYTLVFLGFAPIGNSLIGFIAHYLGTQNSLKLFALFCVAGSILFARFFRKATRQP